MQRFRWPHSPMHWLHKTDGMKQRCIIYLLVPVIVLLQSCSKQSFINTADARVITADTVRFDTVFTTVGSVTQSFTILNDNAQKLRLSSVKLMGGASSAYRINVDGVAGVEASNIELEAGDSIYVFVSVTIDPTSANTPFIVEDSVQVAYNGTNKYVQLRAYGQNAHFYRSAVIAENTVWTNDRPHVITGGLTVAEGNILSIEKGSRIYLHADAPLLVDGTLEVNGTKDERVSFQGDRLDEGYRDLPASWPGIFFNPSSKQNQLKFTVVKNAYQGIVSIGPSPDASPKLELSECILDNIYDIGLWGLYSSIKAVNCRITNCGSNIVLNAGGEYDFTYCTIASFGNAYIEHKSPVLRASDVDEAGNIYPLNLLLQNSILWGEGGNVEDEVQVERKGAEPFQLLLDHSLYKAKQLSPLATLNNAIANQNPAFDSINASRRYYDFHIGQKPSPALGAGVAVPYNIDLDGRERTGDPDLGSYGKP